MIKYNVRSRQIIDLMNEIKSSKLIMAPYFQRKLVWRNIHKVDFIKTILMGFPFPEIFVANGDIDIEAMKTTTCVVDGQQRLNSIHEFINNKFSVDKRYYKDFTADEKEDFLRYEVAIIDLEIKHDDPKIEEIFKRLNRTFYSLSGIEKISSEYGASEMMLVAKMLCKELPVHFYNEADETDELNVVEGNIEYNPNINDSFLNWAKNKNVKAFIDLIIESTIFSGYEISRQVHLNIVLNILGTVTHGIFNRNLNKDILDEFSDEFLDKDYIVDTLVNVAKFIKDMKLKKTSYWFNKANIFSLIVVLFNNLENAKEIGPLELKSRLEGFENNLPPDYKIAAKEGVNNRKERTLRNNYILGLIIG